MTDIKSMVGINYMIDFFSKEREIDGKYDFLNHFKREEKETIVYQYMNASALKGMLNYNELWATNVSFFNDSKEYEYGLNIFLLGLSLYQKYLDSEEKQLSLVINKEIQILAKSSYDFFIKKIDCLIKDKNLANMNKRTTKAARQLINELVIGIQNKNSLNCYVRCFSLDGNLLSQWRGYGDYSVGIYRSNLRPISPKLVVSILTVIYELEKQFDMVSYCIADWLDHVNKRFLDYSDENLEEAIKELSNIILNDDNNYFNKIVASFKNPHFREEKEIRMYIDKPNFDSIEVREDRGIFKPYVKLKYKPLLIKEIYLSPRLSSDFNRAE